MLRLFNVVYGERFIDLYERISFRSLLRQSKNRAALPNDAIVVFYTDNASARKLRDVVGDLRFEINIADTAKPPPVVFQECLICEIKSCLTRNATMLMVTCDMFFGDGSLGNLLAIAVARPGACIAAPNIRVERNSFIKAISYRRWSISNPALVKLALRHQHKTWRDTHINQPMRNCYDAGTSMQRLTPKLYAVSHLLPNCYLARLTSDDLHFFETAKEANAWDHRWPSLLVAQNRHYVIGSSDAFFAAELTELDENHPAVEPNSDHTIDDYREDEPHHRTNRNTVFIWRSA